MKKTLLVFSCICSLFFVSCASKNIAQDENILQAPETITEAQADINTETDQDSPETSDTNTETDSDQEVLFIEEKVELQEPEDFEEPVVITLLPEELVETESQAEAPTEEKEEPLPEEKVEVELIPELEITSDSEVAEADTEDTLSPLANENADQETQKDSDIEVIDDISDISDSSESSDNTEDDVISVGDGEEGAVTGEEEETNNAEEITPSRKVTLKKMEYLDITYPGQGWIYMGITDGSKDLTYFGRKLGTENTKFTLQARNAGKKIVHFYKNDALSGQYIDDYIEVEILNQKGSNKTHIDAPEYKQPVPKKAKEKIIKDQAKNDEEISMENSESSLVQTTSNSSNVSDSNSVSSIENDSKIEKQTSAPKETKNVEGVLEQEEEGRSGERTSSSSSSSSIEKTEDKNSLTDSNTLLQEAQVLYNEKEYKLALEKINSFLESATSKRDLGLYLQGQILEAKSEVQNIKAAIEAYSTLTKNYPASKRWDDANKRMIYLKRFYLEVR
ncbi:MAG: outer membrane protein assembly factor BamD [Treponema sp.]|nr:outer membrane protein assembly factor BamD [Treponema sp.]